MSISPPSQLRQQAAGTLLLVAAAITLLTLSLRVPTSAVGPVASSIIASTGYSSTTISLLTSVPMLCFIITAPLVPALQAKLGLLPLAGWALGATAAGTLLRSLPGAWLLGAGTLVLGVGIAAASVAAAAVVRTLAPAGAAWPTALYTASLSIGPALAAAATSPLAQALGGWRLALAGWALIPLAAAGLLALRRPAKKNGPTEQAAAAAAVPLREAARQPASWAVTVFLALTSLLFYSLVAWLPSMLQDSGHSQSAAGALASLANLAAIPAALGMPLLVQRTARLWVLLCTAPLPFAAGALLLAAGANAPLAIVLMGVGQGASVALAYSLMLAVASSPAHATAISALSQTVGVGLAALGPTGLALVHGAAGSWTPAVLRLAGLAGAQGVLGTIMARWITPAG